MPSGVADRATGREHLAVWPHKLHLRHTFLLMDIDMDMDQTRRSRVITGDMGGREK